MARPLRIEYEGALYHITARGNEKREIFSGDRDRRKFLNILVEKLDRFGVKLHCYVLMDNHYHLLVETPGANLNVFMHAVQSHYTGYYNNVHERVGHLFQGRYKALLVQKEEYLLKVSHYIHLNPVRAGIARMPEDWEWSSYRDYTFPAGRRNWLCTEDILAYYGNNVGKARKKYREAAESGIEGVATDIFSETVAQTILGTKEFVEEIKQYMLVAGETDDSDMPSARQLLAWTDERADSVISAVASYYGAPPESLTTPHTKDNIPRDAAIYYFLKFSKWRVKEIGKKFGISHSGVSHAAKRGSALIAGNKILEKRILSIHN